MIAFASLFLGLVLGSQQVELVVGEEVARVEVFLDGERIGLLSGPPWSLECDFGELLEPHELVAVARDAAGAEVGRARQWINLPQPPAEASLVLNPGEGGRGAIATLSWESLASREPQEIRLSFDGRPVLVTDPARIELPPHDPRQLHFIRAEIDFTETVSSVVEMSFGGTYADQVNTELTAVPVALADDDRQLKEEALARWLRGRDGDLAVAAVEKGPAEVVVVLDRGAQEHLIRRANVNANRRRTTGGRAQANRALRAYAPLGKDQSLRFIWPVPRRTEGTNRTFDLFPRSPEFLPEDGGVIWVLCRINYPAVPGVEPRLTDAVAVAGLTAAGRKRRRAVVLILGDSPSDSSQLEVRQVRHYLEQLQVPLYVWTTAGEAEAGAWGTATPVGTFNKISKAVRGLSRDLDRQRIVWIDGIHLPQDFSLRPEAEAIELVR